MTERGGGRGGRASNILFGERPASAPPAAERAQRELALLRRAVQGQIGELDGAFTVLVLDDGSSVPVKSVLNRSDCLHFRLPANFGDYLWFVNLVLIGVASFPRLRLFLSSFS